MKVVGKFNKISEKLKKEIPSYKRGTVINFQMLNGKKNDDPDSNARQKTPFLYPATQIPTKDRIFDPYLEDEKGKEVGGYVDIVVDPVMDGERLLSHRFFMPGLEAPQFHGRFALTAGKIGDDELFEYLWLSNHNKDNPHRDESIEALYRVLDEAQESKKEAQSADVAFEAQMKVRELKEEDARKIASALNWPKLDKDILMDNLKTYAHKEPKLFLSIANSDPKTLELRSLLKEAFDNQVLHFDAATGRLLNKNNLITVFEVNNHFELMESLISFLNSSNNGEEIIKSVRKQIKK